MTEVYTSQNLRVAGCASEQGGKRINSTAQKPETRLETSPSSARCGDGVCRISLLPLARVREKNINR